MPATGGSCFAICKPSYPHKTPWTPPTGVSVSTTGTRVVCGHGGTANTSLWRNTSPFGVIQTWSSDPLSAGGQSLPSGKSSTIGGGAVVAVSGAVSTQSEKPDTMPFDRTLNLYVRVP